METGIVTGRASGQASAITLADLVGRWRLDRRIHDARAAMSGELLGEAVWTAEGPALRQRETGLLRYGSAPPMQASREYIWRWQAHRFVVLFGDGRPFHDFAPESPEARHHCPPDIYDVRYDFSDWPVWESRWHVTGPRKDALIVSRFTPLD